MKNSNLLEQKLLIEQNIKFFAIKLSETETSDNIKYYQEILYQLNLCHFATIKIMESKLK